MKKLCFKTALTLLFCAVTSFAFAQTVVSGRVTDSNGEPIYGATVFVEGTSNAALTGPDGNYSIEVRGDADVLTFSYVGTQTQNIVVGWRTTIDVVLQENQFIDAVVVIGYGQQKKSVVTAAISTVSSSTLEKTTPVRLDDALKGLTAGVMVTSESGQPGSGSRVQIRGYGTINNSKPLYVVDGIPMTSGIDYLSPGDIERLDILKDAASAAVYGTRGANGVILVTTKSGTQMTDRVSVNYDFHYGVSNPWRKREMLDATEYAVMMNEGSLNAGMGIKYADPYSFGKGTDWQDEIFNKNAPTRSHQISVGGSSARNVYYLSASHLTEEGIIGGNYGRSNYERFTIRLNDTYTLFNKTAERNWLNKMSLTTNTSYSRTLLSGISTNSEYGSPLGSAIALSPILGVYADEGAEELYRSLYFEIVEEDGVDVRKDYNFVRDKKNGRLFTIPGTDYSEMSNPVADLSMPGNKDNYNRFVANFDAQLGIWDALTFKTSVGVDMNFSGTDGWTPIHYLSGNRKSLYSSVSSTMGRSLTWQLENVLSYDKVFAEKHSVSVILGQSALETTGRSLTGSNQDMVEEDPSRANLGFTTGTRDKQGASGYLWADYRIASLFGRVSYNYDERYLIQATIRRDGSSKFGSNNRFAVFPSVSVGWNIRNEPFMEDRAPWLSALKLRASWGRNGIDSSVDAFAYTTLTQSGTNYVLGSGALGNESIIIGVKSTGLSNPDLKWEQSRQTDVGLDLGFFNGALNLSLDYYQKRTEGMIIRLPLGRYTGDSAPLGNVGAMDNSGFEIEAAYRQRLGDFTFNIGGNASYLKNKVAYLGNDTGWLDLDSFGLVGTVSRAENGQPFPYFYGLKTDGIFQNVAELDAYNHTFIEQDENGNDVSVVRRVQPNATPGDVRFVDLNGDGVIDDSDRTKIGKGSPDWVFGFSAGFEWKGIDFSMIWQGVAGVNVFDATRRHGDIPFANLPKYMLDRWTGEGTSNRLPRFTFNESANNNWQSSDLYVKNGDYLRLKNVTLGYTLPAKWTSKVFISKLRLYVSAANVFTFTKYDGFDPEISISNGDNGRTALGIDRGIYPQARTFYFGANLTF